MFAANLKKARYRANLSQAALAEKLFVTQQTVAKWESNRSSPNPESLLRLSEVLEVSLDELLGRGAANAPQKAESTPAQDSIAADTRGGRTQAFAALIPQLTDNELDILLGLMQRLADNKK